MERGHGNAADRCRGRRKKAIGHQLLAARARRMQRRKGEEMTSFGQLPAGSSSPRSRRAETHLIFTGRLPTLSTVAPKPRYPPDALRSSCPLGCTQTPPAQPPGSAGAGSPTRCSATHREPLGEENPSGTSTRLSFTLQMRSEARTPCRVFLMTVAEVPGKILGTQIDPRIRSERSRFLDACRAQNTPGNRHREVSPVGMLPTWLLPARRPSKAGLG